MAAALGLAACAGRPPPQADAGLAAASGVPLETLASGRRTWLQACSGCHRLYRPDERSEASWRAVLPPMARKAKLDDAASGAVLAWLLAARGR